MKLLRSGIIARAVIQNDGKVRPNAEVKYNSRNNGREGMKYYTNNTNNNVKWMCQYDWSKLIESVPLEERYRICCKIIGKDKTDAILKDLAEHPLKRWLFKLKHLKRKYFR